MTEQVARWIVVAAIASAQTVIYLANGASDFLGTGETSSVGPSVLKITIG